MATSVRMVFIPALLLASLTSAGCNRLGGGGASANPKTDDEKTFYALGLDIGKSVEVFQMSPAEFELLKAGLTDAVTKRPEKVEYDKFRPKVSEMAQNRYKARSELEKKRGQEAVEKAAKEPGAQRLPSGVVLKTLRPGTGATPTSTDKVKVNYEGRLLDGTVFDSSYAKRSHSKSNWMALCAAGPTGSRR